MSENSLNNIIDLLLSHEIELLFSCLVFPIFFLAFFLLGQKLTQDYQNFNLLIPTISKNQLEYLSSNRHNYMYKYFKAINLTNK